MRWKTVSKSKAETDHERETHTQRLGEKTKYWIASLPWQKTSANNAIWHKITTAHNCLFTVPASTTSLWWRLVIQQQPDTVQLSWVTKDTEWLAKFWQKISPIIYSIREADTWAAIEHHPISRPYCGSAVGGISRTELPWAKAKSVQNDKTATGCAKTCEHYTKFQLYHTIWNSSNSLLDATCYFPHQSSKNLGRSAS